MKLTKEQILTNELKAKFFALYWGQDVMMKDNVRPFTDLSLKTVSVDGLYWRPEDNFNKSMNFAYLLLKPLSAITDEDAIEVAIIAGNSSYTDDRRAYNGRLLLQEFLRRQCNVYGEDWLKLFDYLRSRGYALPYMGISVEQQVEAGWIKLIE